MDKQKQYIKLRLKLASDKLRVAKLLFKNGEYRDVISRSYYAIFYAAKAFLLSKGKDPSTHKGVDILFREFCASHKAPEISFAKIISVMRESRLDADYKEKAHITKDAACEAIDMAQAFLKEIRRLIK